ncbi:hypothetical protein BN2537_3225 [Streptomyces venezuelae]|nr:hypothetical protein BN2537_3225 [Streptomyces venezuelae]
MTRGSLSFEISTTGRVSERERRSRDFGRQWITDGSGNA